MMKYYSYTIDPSPESREFRKAQLVKFDQESLKEQWSSLQQRYGLIEELADEMLDRMIERGMKGSIVTGINIAKNIVLEELDAIEELIEDIEFFLDEESLKELRLEA